MTGSMPANHARDLLEETNDFADAEHLVDIPGMSSPKVCQLLNRLVSRLGPDERYLEIGSWQGRTLLSAAAHNAGRLCVACDKFRVYGRHTGWGWNARRALRRNIASRAGERAAIHFYDMPSRTFFSRRRFDGTVGVYFYDGDHTYSGTRRSIAAAAPWLSEWATVLVDDWNTPRVRAGTFAGLADASVSILWHRALPGDHTERTWWNGLGVFFVRARGVDAVTSAPRADC